VALPAAEGSTERARVWGGDGVALPAGGRGGRELAGGRGGAGERERGVGVRVWRG
jgi:hypothetical protein